ncbi:MFS transporter [Pseudobacter ginsenosidimutans]|nr:MFS transporter [Pseudobacter ginsenosidimutans]
MKGGQQGLLNAKTATQLIFLVCGLGVASWAPMVPYAKDRLGLHEGQLGILLLFMGGGAFIMMPLAGWLSNKYGNRVIMLAAGLLLGCLLPLLLLIDSVAVMAIALLLFGAGAGAIDVAMNAHGVQVQNLYGKPIMSSLHGLFSVGGLFGSLGLGFLVKTGLQPLHAAIAIGLLLIFITLSQYKRLFNHHQEKEIIQRFNQPDEPGTKGNRYQWLRGSVLFLGFMCFASFLSEGAMLDWSAVYLRDVKGVQQELSGIGYAAFSIAMAVMRLLGDGIVEKWKSKTVVITGSLIATTGLMISILSPSIYLVLAGYILLGIGAANIVPIFFSEGGRLPGIPSTVSIPVITTIGYTGSLAGPALLGFIAHHFSLDMAFGLTALLMLSISIAWSFKK